MANLEDGSASSYELDRTKIVVEKMLGAGQFGEVHQGMYMDAPCAIKQQIIHERIEKHLKVFEDDFIAEAKIQQGFEHRNVTALIGVILTSEPKLIVLELLETDFVEYLRSRKRRITYADETCALLGMALQLGQGVEYIHSKRVVHCDLAARNVMVSDEFVLKIADFGLARKSGTKDCDVSKRMFPISVRWSGPEVKVHRKLSLQSDVWSLGVLVYETMTGGKTPYCMFKKNKEVEQKVLAGFKLPQIKECPQEMYAVLLQCWQFRPQNRPTASAVVEAIRDLIGEIKLNRKSFNEKNGNGYNADASAANVAFVSSQRSAALKVNHVLPEVTLAHEMFPWFHGRAERKRIREHAELLVEHPGDFLIYKTMVAGEYVLSCFSQHPVALTIKKRGAGYFAGGRSFPTVTDLVNYYMQSGIAITFKGHSGEERSVHLTHPIPYVPAEEDWQLDFRSEVVFGTTIGLVRWRNRAKARQQNNCNNNNTTTANTTNNIKNKNIYNINGDDNDNDDYITIGDDNSTQSPSRPSSSLSSSYQRRSSLLVTRRMRLMPTPPRGGVLDHNCDQIKKGVHDLTVEEEEETLRGSLTRKPGARRKKRGAADTTL